MKTSVYMQTNKKKPSNRHVNIQTNTTYNTRIQPPLLPLIHVPHKQEYSTTYFSVTSQTNKKKKRIQTNTAHKYNNIHKTLPTTLKAKNSLQKKTLQKKPKETTTTQSPKP